jgi:DNA-binding CsgD family transcriptional regulator
LRAYLLCRLGELAVDQGRYGEAQTRFRAGLQLYRMLGVRTRLAGVLEGFAMLAAAHGQARRALRLAGAAAALREEVMARPTPRETVWPQSGLERARQQLGDRESDRAWADGLEMSLDQAIDDALDEQTSRVSPAEPAGPSVVAAPTEAVSPVASTLTPTELSDGIAIEPLTERQREVAELVARGLTNRQIGEALVITEGTANLHVKHILRTLGFATRAQIAAWATRQGLAAPLAAP